MVKGAGESLHIPSWRHVGVNPRSTSHPPTNLCHQEAMTRPSPRVCILVGSSNAASQLPTLTGARRGRSQTPAPGTAGTVPLMSPARAAEVPPPPSSVLGDQKSPPHQAVQRQSWKQQQWQGGTGQGCLYGQASVHAIHTGARWAWWAGRRALARPSVLMLAGTCLWLLHVPWHQNTRR